MKISANGGNLPLFCPIGANYHSAEGRLSLGVADDHSSEARLTQTKPRPTSFEVGRKSYITDISYPIL